MAAARSEFYSGVKAELPILVGVVPFGLIYGILARDAGLTALQTQAMSAVVFAGSAQFIMAQLFAIDTPALVIIITAFLVNLRHALYSASLSPYVKQLSQRWKYGLAYLLTDEAYAVTIIHYRESSEIKHKHFYFLGSGLALWTTWQISTAAGILVGSVIPAALPLDFFIALTLIALVVPNLEDKAGLVSALVAGTISVIAFQLPFRLGLVMAALVGIAVGMLVEEKWPAAGSADQEQAAEGEAPG
jgi:4-azaleucine resistance transporter AzlC